jgi:N-acetylneuraminic acid mutarotase
VSIDGGAPQAIGINATFTISSVAAGSHTVELSELSDLCHVEGENPRTVSASGGSTIQVAFAVTCMAPPVGPGVWNVAAPMPTPRQLVAGAVVQNRSGEYLFYTIGGSNPNNTAMQRMEVYNAATDSWARKANLPVKRALARAEVIREKVYVVGGTDLSGTATANLYIYDTGLDTWTEGPDLPIATANSILGVIRGQLYVVASTSPSSPTQRLYRYEPETNTWTRLADPTNNHFGGIGGVINSNLYVAWGRSHTVDVYDPVTNTWTNKLTAAYSGAPVYGAESICEEFCSVSGSAGLVLYDQLYVIGGLNDDESMPMAQAYDPIANTWTRKADMRNQREHSPVAGKIRNAAGLLQIIIVGGFDNSQGEDVTETEKYTP